MLGVYSTDWGEPHVSELALHCLSVFLSSPLLMTTLLQSSAVNWVQLTS